MARKVGGGRLVAASLFSGCMGLDLGLEAANIHTAVCVENDRACRATIRQNRPDVTLFDDVRTVAGEQIQLAAGGSVDVLVGAPPCQSFSTIGYRRSMDDERGRLILEYLRLLRELKPPHFVLENVVGILSAATRGDKLLFPWLLTRFRRLGYHVSWWKLNALDYGSPQKRLRVVIAGGLESEVRQPQVRPGLSTLGEAISTLKTPGECGRFSPRIAAVLDQVPPGGDWRSLPVNVRDLAMGKADRSSGGLTAFYRRLSYDRPSPTLVTSPTQRATTLCHPAATRPLSVAEYKRVQGFPDDWELSGSTASKYRQLGNAVPVPLAAAVGRVITDA